MIALDVIIGIVRLEQQLGQDKPAHCPKAKSDKHESAVTSVMVKPATILNLFVNLLPFYLSTFLSSTYSIIQKIKDHDALKTF